MVFSYPEFHGKKGEDVEDFLEQMEVACISNHIEDPVQTLRLLQICLKDEARKWLKSHEGELQRAQPPIVLTLDNLKEALKEEFVKAEDPEKLWQEVKEVRQRERESVGDYIDRFSSLWEKLSGALQPQVPPEMMKKDQFMIGLRADLRLRVELKKPRSYEEAVDVAKRKEWKLTMMSHMGVTDSLPLAMEARRPKPIVQRVPVEVLQPVV